MGHVTNLLSSTDMQNVTNLLSSNDMRQTCCHHMTCDKLGVRWDVRNLCHYLTYDRLAFFTWHVTCDKLLSLPDILQVESSLSWGNGSLQAQHGHNWLGLAQTLQILLKRRFNRRCLVNPTDKYASQCSGARSQGRGPPLHCQAYLSVGFARNRRL